MDNPEFKEGVKEEWEEDIISRATRIIEMGGEIYQYAYTKKYVETFFKRLGLAQELIDDKNPDAQNVQLLVPMLEALEKLQTDFNLFFLKLQNVDFNSSYEEIAELLLEQYDPNTNRNHKEDIAKQVIDWLKIYHGLKKNSAEFHDVSNAAHYNPRFLPRNWILIK